MWLALWLALWIALWIALWLAWWLASARWVGYLSPAPRTPPCPRRRVDRTAYVHVAVMGRSPNAAERMDARELPAGADLPVGPKPPVRETPPTSPTPQRFQRASTLWLSRRTSERFLRASAQLERQRC